MFTVVNLFYQGYHYYYAEDVHYVEAEGDAFNSTHEMVSKIDSLLHHIEEKTNITVNEILTAPDLNTINYDSLCREKSYDLGQLLGVTISFEANVLSNDSLFSIYYDKYQNSVIRLDSIYDYTSPNQLNNKWYVDVKQSQKGKWTTPYYGSGAKNLITDYNAPIFKNEKFIGVVSYTVSINCLISVIHEISLSQTGLGFLIHKDGTIITHPNPDYVLKEKISKLITDSNLVAEVMSNSDGFIPFYKSELTGEVAFSYQTLENKEWKLFNMLTNQDLFNHGKEDKRLLINLFLSITLVIAMILLLIINRQGINKSEAWTYSTFITLALISCIGFIWYLNLSNLYEPISTESNQVKSQVDIDNYLIRQNMKRNVFGFDDLIEVPTGVVIEKFEHEDTYNVGISGWIWQKYPLNEHIKPGIHFTQLSPFAESAYKELISQDTIGGRVVVKWKFRSTFIFDFKYLEYPFNTKNMVLQIIYPDHGRGVVFTPDVLGYESLEPSTLPGILPNSVTSSIQYVASVFSLGVVSLSGNLGVAYLSEFAESPVFQFEIKTRTPFLNAVIKQIIPILLISLMMFLLLFSLRKTDKETKSIGIETIAGLLFILVLSHIDFRQVIFSPEVTYLESFYFVIYIMMAFISVSIVWIDLGKVNWVTKNGLLNIKLLYWPFLFFSVLIITLFIFY